MLHSPENRELPAKGAEALLLAEIDRLSGQQVWCTSLGRAQWAAAYALQHADAQVTCNFLDCYLQHQAQLATAGVANLAITCQADIPAENFDLAVFPTSMTGDGELLREQIQAAYEQLLPHGMLVTATDNPTDVWLHTLLQEFFPKVTCSKHATGVVYYGKKQHPLKKIKNYAAVFNFRHNTRLFTVHSRPGVFSHRRLDLGARALMEVMQLASHDKVLEIGCGSGAVSFVAATVAATVCATDCNPRAVACTQAGAQSNQLANLQTMLCADARSLPYEQFSKVLANPPYYSQTGIADVFLRGAHYTLQPKGQLYLVTKQVDWFTSMLPQYFTVLQTVQNRNYTIFHAEKM